MYEASGADALIGGDWYDVFRLPDGRVVLSVGDVIGSGLTAAVTMAAVRQAIRGAVHVYPEPNAVLDAVDRTLRSEQPDRIVTTFLGILDPLTHTLSYASAGHPPPLLRCADGTIIEVRASDLPLGLRDRQAADESRLLAIPNDSLLVLYTDGLTEATHDVIEGEARLRSALSREDVYRSAEPAAAIRNAILEEIHDDVAILAVRVHSAGLRMKRWALQAGDTVSSGAIRREFSHLLRLSGASQTEARDAELILGELIGNVVRHTNGKAEVFLDLTTGTAVLHVLDWGPGFVFHARLPKDYMSESGRGLYLIAKFARDISVVPCPSAGSHARVVLSTNNIRPTMFLQQGGK